MTDVELGIEPSTHASRSLAREALRMSLSIALMAILAACGGSTPMGDPDSGPAVTDGATTVVRTDGGSTAPGTDSGSTGPSTNPNDPRAAFVGNWVSRDTHHWTYACPDGTSGGYDRTQTGFYTSIELGGAGQILITVHDPEYPQCTMQGDHRAGSCAGTFAVDGRNATASTSDLTIAYVISADGTQLSYQSHYSAMSNGMTCQWTESDLDIHGSPTTTPSGPAGCTRSTELDSLCGGPSSSARGYTCDSTAEPPSGCDPAGPPGSYCCS